MKAKRARSLAQFALVGIALYVAIDIALAVLRPDVSLIHNPESDYGRGPYAWLMDLNFLLRGVLSLAAIGAIELAVQKPARLRFGLGLIAMWAVASALLAFFPDSPAGGPATASGRIHLLLAGIAFIAASVGTLLVSVQLRLEPAWRPRANLMIGLSAVAIVAGLVTGRTLDRLASDGGLAERIFLGLILSWMALAMVQVIRSSDSRMNASSWDSSSIPR